VSDGTRTHDRLDHNQELYQLSYAHRGERNLPLPPPGDWTSVTIAIDVVLRGGGGGGMLGGFLNSGFGRAMEMGAGIALGGDLINSIF
jgi:hypothetical protein